MEKNMEFPTKSDYTKAFKKKQFSNSLLQQLDFNTKNPESYSGGFSIVFPAYLNEKKYALKCWTEPLIWSEMSVFERLQKIKEHPDMLNLKGIIDFQIVDGIIVNGQSYPVLLSEWIDGENLINISEKYCNGQIELNEYSNLITEFYEISKEWKKKKISHGDLNFKNIFFNTTIKKLQIIDYDSMFISNLFDVEHDIVTGSPYCQHPRRNEIPNTKNTESFLLSRDDFSEVIIYVSLLLCYYYPFLMLKENEHAIIFENLSRNLHSVKHQFLDIKNKISQHEEVTNSNHYFLFLEQKEYWYPKNPFGLKRIENILEKILNCIETPNATLLLSKIANGIEAIRNDPQSCEAITRMENEERNLRRDRPTVNDSMSEFKNKFLWYSQDNKQVSTGSAIVEPYIKGDDIYFSPDNFIQLRKALLEYISLEPKPKIHEFNKFMKKYMQYYIENDERYFFKVHDHIKRIISIAKYDIYDLFEEEKRRIKTSKNPLSLRLQNSKKI